MSTATTPKDEGRVFSREDLEAADLAVIRAWNDEPDLRSSFLGSLQIALESLGLRTDIDPPIPAVTAYREGA